MAAPPCSSYGWKGLFVTALPGPIIRARRLLFLVRVCGVSGMIKQPSSWQGGEALNETWADDRGQVRAKKSGILWNSHITVVGHPNCGKALRTHGVCFVASRLHRYSRTSARLVLGTWRTEVLSKSGERLLRQAELSAARARKSSAIADPNNSCSHPPFWSLNKSAPQIR